MTKKNKKQRLEESLNEAINPKIDRAAVTRSLLGNYLPKDGAKQFNDLDVQNNLSGRPNSDSTDAQTEVKETPKVEILGAQSNVIGRPNENNLDALTPKAPIRTSKKSIHLDALTPKENNLDAQNNEQTGKWVKYESQRKTDRLSLRPDVETLKKFKVYCAQKDLTLTEFFELSGNTFIDLDAQKTNALGVLTPSDDRRLKTLFKTNIRIINLFLVYNSVLNPQTQWKPKDDAVGAKYNEVDLKLIECGIVYTQTRYTELELDEPPQRFKYYQNEIDKFISYGYSDQTIEGMVLNARDRWKQVTGKSVDLSFLDEKS